MDSRTQRILFYLLGVMAVTVLWRKRKPVKEAIMQLTGDPKRDFVAKIKPDADALSTETGIAPLIAISQAGLESGWGRSGLTRNYNNLFGYTADAWLNNFLVQKGMGVNVSMLDILKMDLSAAPFAVLQTHEESKFPPAKITFFLRSNDLVSAKPNAKGGSDLMVWRPFKRYNTWGDSLRDWAKLLSAPRYAKALAAAKAGDLGTYSQEITAAGYATESDYATQIAQVGQVVQGIVSA